MEQWQKIRLVFHDGKSDKFWEMASWPYWMLEYLGEDAVETLGVLVREVVTAECRKSAAAAVKLVETGRGFREMGLCLQTQEGQKTFLPLMDKGVATAIPALLDLLVDYPREAELRPALVGSWRPQ